MVAASTGTKIPVITARGLVFSAWTPSPEELKQMQEGVPLWLIQKATFIPEMTMVVGERRMVVPHSLHVAAVDAVAMDPIIAEAKVARDATFNKVRAFIVGMSWVVAGLLIWGGIWMLRWR